MIRRNLASSGTLPRDPRETIEPSGDCHRRIPQPAWRTARAAGTRDIERPVEIFGSRIDDTSRGGDIDLMVFAPGLAADERLRLSLRIAVAFRSVCDEKIDVHVLDSDDLSTAERAFLSVIHGEPLNPGRLVGA